MTDALVALGGTTLGAALSFIFLTINTNRSADAEKQKALRSERLDAYVNFASSILEYRRTQVARWSSIHDGETADRTESAERESRANRAQAWTSYYHLRLVSDDASVDSTALEAMNLLRNFRTTTTVSDVDRLASEVRERIEDFIRAAQQVLA